MAKTTKKKSTKKAAGEKAAAKKSTSRKAETAIEQVEPAEATPDTKTPTKPARAKEPRPRDPRLPAPGTVIQKKNRAGEILAEVTVIEDGGFEYKSTRYKSLSAAAQAANNDLGRGSGRAVNGYLWFGLINASRKGTDPIAALTKAWHIYQDRMAIFQNADIAAEQRTAAAEVIEEHANTLMDRSRTFLAGMPA